MKIESHSLIETRDVARSILESVHGEKSHAEVWALKGDLGAGKTAFVKCLACLMGVDDVITSPTFVLMKSYTTKHPIFQKLTHIDAYRLEQASDIEKLGWAEALKDPHTLICIEWPEHIGQALPKTARTITFTFIDEATRVIDDQEYAA